MMLIKSTRTDSAVSTEEEDVKIREGENRSLVANVGMAMELGVAD